jgi:hypothetical protein
MLREEPQAKQSESDLDIPRFVKQDGFTRLRLWLRGRIFFSVSTGDFGRSLKSGPLPT